MVVVSGFVAAAFGRGAAEAGAAVALFEVDRLEVVFACLLVSGTLDTACERAVAGDDFVVDVRLAAG
jgi:hypothetical protein